MLYGLFMGLALVVALLARRLLPPDPPVRALPRGQRWAVGIAAFVGGVLGARLPFFLLQEGGWLHDGKTILAGFAGGYLAVEIAKAALRIRAKTGDSFAVPLALACAVGRWGCFCNGCCAGTPSALPWARDFGDGVARHPTQAYESLFHVVMAGVLLVLARRGALRLQRLKLYLIAYAVYRFVVEWIRVEPRGWLGLSVYQWAAGALASAVAAHWAWDRRRLIAAPPSVSRIPSGSLPTTACSRGTPRSAAP